MNMKAIVCLSNLIPFCDSMIGRVDEGGAVDTEYLNFSKGFDVVSHSLLIAKLVRHGLDSWTTR